MEETALTRREDARAAAEKERGGTGGDGNSSTGDREGDREGFAREGRGGSRGEASHREGRARCDARDRREERTRTVIAPCLGAVARLSRAEPWRRDVTTAPRLAAAGAMHALADIAAIVCGAGEKRARWRARGGERSRGERQRNLSVCSSDRATLGGAVSMLRDSEVDGIKSASSPSISRRWRRRGEIDRRSRVTSLAEKISPFCATRTQDVWKKRARDLAFGPDFHFPSPLVAGAAPFAHFERRERAHEGRRDHEDRGGSVHDQEAARGDAHAHQGVRRSDLAPRDRAPVRQNYDLLTFRAPPPPIGSARAFADVSPSLRSLSFFSAGSRSEG